MRKRKPKILVSSSVYDKAELLERIFATLRGLGYDVWMSYRGTIPLDSKLSNFANCLKAVDDCDLFLSIISGYYGSGRYGNKNSITHQELSRAIHLKKRRWVLVHDDVLVVRNFVKSIKRLEKTKRIAICSKLDLQRHDPISDMRVLAMYEEAIRAKIKLNNRTGNWVQHYRTPHDVLTFITAQFGDPTKF